MAQMRDEISYRQILKGVISITQTLVRFETQEKYDKLYSGTGRYVSATNYKAAAMHDSQWHTRPASARWCVQVDP